MRDILAELEQWLAAGEAVALATVVRAIGSSPRPVGAKLIVTRSGRMAGSVSGGCVEGAVFEVALETLDSLRPRLVTYGISDEQAWNVGLSCGGTIDVFVEALNSETNTTLLPALIHALHEQEPVVQATLVRGNPLGAHLLIYEDGHTVGTLGSPSLDELVSHDALTFLHTGEAETRAYTLPCGGQVEVFLEAHLPSRHLVVVGAVHIAIPLVAMAKQLDYHTTVIDAREFFATRERLPHADELIVAWPDEALEQIKITPQTDIVILAHDEKFEDPAFHIALRSRAGYIGAIGSRKTNQQRLERLRQAGFTNDDLARIHAPIGIDIGAKTPAEIALSILAEIVAVRRGRLPTAALHPAKSRAPAE